MFHCARRVVSSGSMPKRSPFSGICFRMSARTALKHVSMSVMFRSLRTLATHVRKRLATECQYISTRRCGEEAKRDPKTASAFPARIGASITGYSAGSYSRSASWMIATSPVISEIAVRIAAPLP